MKQSIVQIDDVKRCFISKQTRGVDGSTLEKHHIMNGSLRKWADEEGLWVWLTPEMHRIIHETSFGVLVQKNLLKQIAQYAFIMSKMPKEMVEQANEEWMGIVRRNYI